MKTIKYTFLFMSTLLSLSALPQKTTEMEEIDAKPNLVFIYASQFRRQAMEFWRNQENKGALNVASDWVETPNLDKLANDGIVFTQAMSTTPIGSPFRGMMMTGMFPAQNGLEVDCAAGETASLKEDAATITDVLYGQGYNTAYFGKAHWHRTEPLFDSAGNYVGTTESPGGFYVDSNDTYVPPGASRHNIEYLYQVLGGIHKDPYVYSNDSVAINGKKDGERHRPKIFSPLNEANQIIKYINNSHGQRNVIKPFGIFWALNPPHSPYSSIDDCDEDVYNKYYKYMCVDAMLDKPNVKTFIAEEHVAYYFANITSVDEQIGRVISELESAGLKDNTIIVFTSDHGEMMGAHDRLGNHVEYEESFGVPFLISYPDRLQHRIENLLLGSVDIMPTLLGLMGMEESIPASVQGTDYSALLLDLNTVDVTRAISAIFLTKNGNKGIRTNQYTFTVSEDSLVKNLFDNINDPYQLVNLDFSLLPEEEQTFLLKELGNWLAKANDQWYQEKKLADFIVYPVDTVPNDSIPLETHVFDKPVNSQYLDLRNNYPNPFNSSTNITVMVYEPLNVDLSIYNINGQRIKTLYKGNLSQGQHTFHWNATNSNNGNVSTGVYICRLKSKDAIIRKKMFFQN